MGSLMKVFECGRPVLSGAPCDRWAGAAVLSVTPNRIDNHDMDTLKMLVRRAIDHDAGGINTVSVLAGNLLRRIYRRRPDSVVDLFPAARYQRIVAFVDGQITGFLTYVMEGHTYRLLELSVHPNYHRRGIARRMVRYLSELAVERGVRRIRWSVIREAGWEAVAARLGFKPLDMRPAEGFESDLLDRLTQVEMELAVALARPAPPPLHFQENGAT